MRIGALWRWLFFTRVSLACTLDQPIPGRLRRLLLSIRLPASSTSVCPQAPDGVSVRSEDFTCSQGQMLDLLASVKDATKQVERILASD